MTVARFEALLRGLCYLSTFSKNYNMFTVHNIPRCRMFMFVCVVSHAYVKKMFHFNLPVPITRTSINVNSNR